MTRVSYTKLCIYVEKLTLGYFCPPCVFAQVCALLAALHFAFLEKLEKFKEYETKTGQQRIRCIQFKSKLHKLNPKLKTFS